MRKTLLLLATALLWQKAQAQTGSVGIGTTSPDANAALEINSTSKGLLIPRLTEAQRLALATASLPAGLMVFQTNGTSPGFWYFYGSQWLSLPDANTAGTVRSVTAGTGLSGGTITTTGTIAMPNVGTAGTYGTATQVPRITTDAQGRVTAVTPTTITAVQSVATGTGLTGGPITNTGTISLSNVGTAGTYGTATQVPQITTDAQGRVTAVTPITISAGTVQSVTAGTGLSGGTITTTGTIAMPNVGTAGTYGTATQVPRITTDAQGRVTAVTPTTITAVQSVTAGTGLSGGTITGTGTIALTNVGTAGTYGSGSQVPVITTDAQGRVTGVSTSAVAVTTPACPTGYTTYEFTTSRLCLFRDVFTSNWNSASNWCPTLFSGTLCRHEQVRRACNVGFVLTAGTWLADRIADDRALYVNNTTCTNFDGDADAINTTQAAEYCCVEYMKY